MNEAVADFLAISEDFYSCARENSSERLRRVSPDFSTKLTGVYKYR